MALRFPNPGSDIGKFTSMFRMLHKDLQKESDFDLDLMVQVAIAHSQTSSCGAIGEEALRRSTRADRSRDPLFNQLKMYSELYRMLGWIHSSSGRQKFNVSELGSYVAADDGIRLVLECITSIVFPNPYVDNVGVLNSRPFLNIFKIIKELSGRIYRDELIIGILGMMDDQTETAFGNAIEAIQTIREGGRVCLLEALSKVAKGIQINTLRNYTRFPLGVLRHAGWFEPSRDRRFYERPTVFYQITPVGEHYARTLDDMVDVRHSEIEKYPEAERCSFILLTHYAMLERAGYKTDSVRDSIQKLTDTCSTILGDLGIPTYRHAFYSPYQQAPHADILIAEDL